MLGFIKGLLSSGEIVKGGMSAMDKLVLTDEEKLDYKLRFIAASMPMNRARRFITIALTMTWAIHSYVALLLFLAESEKFQTFIPYMNSNITNPFMIAVAFYFWNGKTSK